MTRNELRAIFETANNKPAYSFDRLIQMVNEGKHGAYRMIRKLNNQSTEQSTFSSPQICPDEYTS